MSASGFADLSSAKSGAPLKPTGLLIFAVNRSAAVPVPLHCISETS
jgi:hypothetical protein